MPPLGILHVGTAVKLDGLWDVEIIDELNWRRTVNKRDLDYDPIADHRDLQARRPAQAVGFYAGLSSTVPRLFKLAQFYRSLGIPTITGGAHADALPDEALHNSIDVVVHGEGEETSAEVLRAWATGCKPDDIHGISFIGDAGGIINTTRRLPICDLDRIPIPDLDLLVELARPLSIAPFERTRGCNYHCEFCVVSDRFGPSRSASPEHVAAEVEKRVEQGFRHFFCVDDNFTQGREDTLKLLTYVTDIQKKHKVKLNITVQVRSSVGRDRELMQAMRAAGIKLLCIGLESPILEELEEMNKHQTPEQVESDLRSLRRNGFMIHGMFIFGYPLKDAETSFRLTLRERADRYISFIKRNAIDTIMVLKPVPIPGSRLARRLNEQGRILPLNLVGWDKYDGNFLCFLPEKGVSAVELQKQATRIMRRFYNPFSFLRFPVLVFTTPVEVVRDGFQRAREFAKNPSESIQMAMTDGFERASAFREGFREAGREVNRRWRNAIMRTLGSAVVSNWLRSSHHQRFLTMLSNFQATAVRNSKKSTANTTPA